ncbi:hypothetical protein KY285_013370 [Solanum tuberosum]|nr:hypothetical protein KY285_013370 [Solanum tuberosum]
MVNINKEEVLSLTRGKRKFGNKITIPTSTKLEGEVQQVSSNKEIFYSKVSGNSEMPEINIEKILRNSAKRLKKIGIQGIDPGISSQAGSQEKVDGGIVDLEPDPLDYNLTEYNNYQFEAENHSNTIRCGDSETFMECIDEDINESKFDDEIIREQNKGDPHRGNHNAKSQILTSINNLSPRNSFNPDGSLSDNLVKQQFSIPLFCLQEPMVNGRQLDKFKRRLGTHQDFRNCSKKIWILWSNNVNIEIIHDT